MSYVILAVTLIIAAFGITAALRSPAAPPYVPPEKERKYCPSCGTVGAPVFRKDGSDLLELLLWLFLIVPGIIYSIWRSSTKRWACPKCGSSGMIPLDSPKAQAANRNS